MENIWKGGGDRKKQKRLDHKSLLVKILTRICLCFLKIPLISNLLLHTSPDSVPFPWCHLGVYMVTPLKEHASF